ncbi:MAG: aminotransferase class I/II-fold pyridoxal phosphate-dependent enzyme [Rhodospirillales bacterium]|nr:aminotransferase class I/II-fold pyridoxal phosphate-dependent enzyme [Alphaproteobacteria bacterium]MBL6928821.1 aminotransferase class I/II-fold pyridoxal phosphate-dependent enzyme [Rhodospirillales bacterium]
MLNPALETLNDFPFDRLRSLLEPLRPPETLDPLMLSIGEPKHTPPPMVAEILHSSAAGWGKYPGVDGTPEFRRAVADWLTRRYDLADGLLDPDTQILPVSGTREAIFMIGQAVVPRRKRGHRPNVLVPNPYYHVYSAVPRLNSADPVFVPATEKTGFLPDFTAVDPEILEHTALAYFCSPSNPQGSVADVKVLKNAIVLARKYDFVLAVDECYSEIYMGDAPAGALNACAELVNETVGVMDNVVIFNSLSKRSSVPGLRSGFVAGPADIMKVFRRLRTYGGAGVPLPTIDASTALWQDEDHVAESRALYCAKFEAAQEIMGPRFGNVMAKGGFFLWLNVGNGEAATRRLWTQAAIRVLPGAYLSHTDEYGKNPGTEYIRIALVHDLATTTEALERVVKVL